MQHDFGRLPLIRGRPNLEYVRPNSGQLPPNLCRVRARPGRSQPDLAGFCPKPGHGQPDLGRDQPHADRLPPKFGRCWPHSADIGRRRDDFGPNWVVFGQVWAVLGHLGPTPTKREPNSAGINRIGPSLLASVSSKLDEVWPALGPTLGQPSAKLNQVGPDRSQLVELWPTVGQIVANFGQNRPNLVKFRPPLVTPWGAVGLPALWLRVGRWGLAGVSFARCPSVVAGRARRGAEAARAAARLRLLAWRRFVRGPRGVPAAGLACLVRALCVPGRSLCARCGRLSWRLSEGHACARSPSRPWPLLRLGPMVYSAAAAPMAVRAPPRRAGTVEAAAGAHVLGWGAGPPLGRFRGVGAGTAGAGRSGVSSLARRRRAVAFVVAEPALPFAVALQRA